MILFWKRGMSLVKLFTQFWNKYMKSPVEGMDISEFSVDVEKRYQIVFSGVVQGVGFRYETWRMAQKLGLTGFVENLSNGDVQVEIQGPKNKILYLIDYIKSIPRIHIDKMELEEMECKEEKDFEAIY